MIFFKNEKESDEHSLKFIIDKKSNTGYLFVNINNDLGLAIEAHGTKWTKLQKMTYAYARRIVVSAMFIQGFVDQGAYDHVMMVFKGIQLETDTTKDFQNNAGKDAIIFLLEYSPIFSMLFVENLVRIAQDYEINEEKKMSDKELVESIIETAYYEQSNRC